MQPLFLVHFVILPLVFNAQFKIATVYKTSKDFTQNTALYQLDSSTQNIKQKTLFSNHYLYLTTTKATFKILKDSLFGFKTIDGTVYRLFGPDCTEYKLLDTGLLCLYSCYITDYSTKTPQVKEHYFFSKNLQEPLLSLCIRNLKKVYLGNYKFAELLDIEFPNDHSSSLFEDEAMRSKIPVLLKQSL